MKTPIQKWQEEQKDPVAYRAIVSGPNSPRIDIVFEPRTFYRIGKSNKKAVLRKDGTHMVTATTEEEAELIVRALNAYRQ